MFATAAMGVMLTVYVCSLDLPDCVSKSLLAQVWGFSALGREGAAKLYFSLGYPHCRCHAWGISPSPCKISLPSIVRHLLHSLASKLMLAKILLNVQFIFRKVSQVSTLGERASGLSFHILGHHLLSLPHFYSCVPPPFPTPYHV